MDERGGAPPHARLGDGNPRCRRRDRARGVRARARPGAAAEPCPGVVVVVARTGRATPIAVGGGHAWEAGVLVAGAERGRGEASGWADVHLDVGEWGRRSTGGDADVEFLKGGPWARGRKGVCGWRGRRSTRILSSHLHEIRRFGSAESHAGGAEEQKGAQDCLSRGRGSSGDTW